MEQKKYINEFAGLLTFIKIIKDKLESQNKIFKKLVLIKKYSQHNSRDKYENIITNQNRKVLNI